jgi:hypothetical protein
MECIEQSGLRELGEFVLEGFDKRIESMHPDLCVPFHNEARQLETEILFFYRLVAQCVRNDDNLDSVAACWGLMVHICDESMRRLSNLALQHPYCGAQIYYDRLLDLRNKCNRLHQMHS